jgi:hypothetical protein
MVGGARKLPPYARRPRHRLMFKSTMKSGLSLASVRAIALYDHQFLDAV